MIEGNVDDAIAVLDIEYHGVAANFTPATNDPYTMIAASHDAVR